MIRKRYRIKIESLWNNRKRGINFKRAFSSFAIFNVSLACISAILLFSSLFVKIVLFYTLLSLKLDGKHANDEYRVIKLWKTMTEWFVLCKNRLFLWVIGLSLWIFWWICIMPIKKRPLLAILISWFYLIVLLRLL